MVILGLRSICFLWFIALFFMGSVRADESANDLIANLGLVESDRPVRERDNWRKPKRILIMRLSPRHLALLQQQIPDVELIMVRSTKEAMKNIATADALVGTCSTDLLEAGSELRWIHVVSAGVEHCDFASEIRERNILVTNMQRVTSDPIAEHVMMLLLSLSRNLTHYMHQQSLENWVKPPFGTGTAFELQGGTLMVVGLGGIGTAVAERAHAFGMRVIAIRNSNREGPDFVSYVGLSDELLDLAAQADVVVNALPLTPSTEGLFDAKFFSSMKEEAYFINVGRGKSVVTSDLIAALEKGQLAGAGLDVVDPEPLPQGHPLWRAPNVVITPHIAATSDQNAERVSIVIREIIRRYAMGERVYSVVNVDKRY